MEAEKAKQTADKAQSGEINFTEMTTVQKVKAIDKIIDENIRPMLMMDGGNMEIIDIKETSDSYIDVYIRYLGACNGCASGYSGTLFAIESVLQEKLAENIRVLPI